MFIPPLLELNRKPHWFINRPILIYNVFRLQPGRTDFSGIDNAALDFSQLEEYINDEANNNM